MSFLKDVVKANIEIYNLINSGEISTCEFLSLDDKDRGAGGDRTLLIDKKAEEIFVSKLSQYGKIFSEESGEIGEGDYEIILDPIDGSSNLASNFPYYGTSVTLRKNRKPMISVVANLANGDYFYKDESGAFKCNFLTSSCEALKPTKERAQMGIFEKSYVSSEVTKKVLSLKMKFRTPGAVALSLVYAYNTNFVIFNGVHREYDIIAGLHICEDLHTYVTENLIIVSKDEETFLKIKELLI